MMSSTLAMADIDSIMCTDVGGNLKIEESVVKMTSYGLAGKREQQFEMKELNFVGGPKTILNEQTTNVDTICNISQKTIEKTYAQTVSMSKKDGSIISADDTPETEVKTKTAIVLCYEVITQDWPCK